MNLKAIFPADILHSLTGYTRGERNGSLLMMGLALLLLGVKISLPYFFRPNLQQLDVAFLPAAAVTEKQGVSPRKLYNLNLASAEELQQLQLPAWLCRRVVRFRERRPFLQLTDLKKVYGMTDTYYARVVSRLYVKETGPAQAGNRRKPAEMVLLDINAADSAALEALPGIGAYTARKVIRFRDALGGFYSLEQLKELKGARPEMVETLCRLVFVRPGSWKKMKINQLSEQELAAHPYLDFRQARVIRNYIEAHGALKSSTDLAKTAVLSEQEIKRLEAYLDWD